MKLTLVVVNYRSAAWTARAVASARAAFSSAIEVIIVDNSVDPAEVQSLRALQPERLIVSEANVGYGAAVNAALALCTGKFLAISNPDVVYREGAFDELVAAVERGAAVAGPKLTWDDAGRWILPPADLPTGWSKRAEMLAQRSPAFARLRGRLRFRRRVAFWNATRTRSVRALSGAVMVMRRELLQRIGGFDERFRLYFEEMDLIRRIARTGGRLAYVPAAVCRHAYNQSAAGSPESGAWFRASEREFFRKWGSASLVRAMDRFEAASSVRPEFRVLVRPSMEVPAPPGQFIVEASPLATFDTAAGHFPETTSVVLPDEVAGSYRGGELYLRVSTSEGRVVSRGVWKRT